MTAGELRSRRLALGLTQDELATRLAVHRTTVNRWEAGALAIERPAMLRAMVDVIEADLAADPDWQEERNRRMQADMQRRMRAEEATASPERDAAERWFNKPKGEEDQ